MEVEVDVLSADAVRLREGMAVELLRWGGTPPLAGRVRRVEPGGFTKFSALGVEEQRVWVIVEIASPREEWAGLGESYRVNARFILREAADVLRVPSSAVFRDDGNPAVFRIDGSRARLTQIQTGFEGEGWIQVAGGLDEGDRVVLHPDRELGNGGRVRVRQ
jgi:HlyD family secretion protein